MIFQIHSAVATDRTKRQWIDLGLHTEACLTQPETCGTAGGAISLWLNLVDCPVWSGVLSSRESGKTSSFILCIEHGIRYHSKTRALNLNNLLFKTKVSIVIFGFSVYDLDSCAAVGLYCDYVAVAVRHLKLKMGVK